MAFLFVPINQMVLGSVTMHELPEVTSMQNFFRQLGGSIGISSLDTLLTRFTAQNYRDLMGHVSALNPAGLQAMAQTQALASSKMANAIGMWNPATLAAKALLGRVMLQTFLMSFGQICWVIMLIVGCAIIPLVLIKPTVKAGAKLIDAH